MASSNTAHKGASNGISTGSVTAMYLNACASPSTRTLAICYAGAGLFCVAHGVHGFLYSPTSSPLSVAHWYLLSAQIGVGLLLIRSNFGALVQSNINTIRRVKSARGFGVIYPTPTVVLSNVVGDPTSISESFRNKGLVIVNMIQVNDPPVGSSDPPLYVIALEATQRLLEQMACVYAKGYSTSVTDSPPNHVCVRLVEKAIGSLCDGVRFDNYQVMPCGGLNVDNILGSDRARQQEDLNKYFGCKVAALFEWINRQRVLLIPAVLLFVLASLTNSATTYAPIAAIIFTFGFSAFLPWWRMELLEWTEKFTLLNGASEEEDMDLAKFATKLTHRVRFFRVICTVIIMFSFMVVLCVIRVMFERINLAIDAFVGVRCWVMLILQVLYYCISMMIVRSIEYSILNRITKFEMNPTRKLEHFSGHLKLFVLKMTVFGSSIFYFLLLEGQDRDEFQLKIIALVASHYFLGGFVSRAASAITKRVAHRSKQLSDRVNSSAWTTRSRMKAFDVKTLALEQHSIAALIEGSSPGAHKKSAGAKLLSQGEEFILDECLKQRFVVPKFYNEMVVYLGIILIAFPVAPLCVPLCAYCVCSYSGGLLQKLISDCGRPLTSREDGTMEPWLSVLEYFSIFAIVWNVFTLFALSVDMTKVSTTSSLLDSMETTVGTSPSLQSVGLISWIHKLNVFAGARDTSISSVLWLVCLEHVLLFLRCICWPAVLRCTTGKELRQMSAATSDRISSIETRLYQYWFHLTHVAAQRTQQKQAKVKNSAIVRLSGFQSKLGVEISPLAFLGLAALPYAVQRFACSYWAVAAGIVSFCGFYFYRSSQHDCAIESSRLVDSELKSMVRSEFPGFMLGAEMERCQWCNTLLDYTWPQLSQYVINMVRKMADPVLSKAKPPFASHLKISRFDMGSVPPRILGFRVLNAIPGRDIVEMDVDFIFNSDMEVTLSLGLSGAGGQQFDINFTISNFKMSGTGRVQCLQPIPSIPPFAWVNGTFYKPPSIDFSLNIINDDLDLLNLGLGLPGLSLHSMLKAGLMVALNEAVMYPKGIKQPMVTDPSKFNKIGASQNSEDDRAIDGILAVSILNCTNLVIGDITSSDPYVKLVLNDQEDQTDVIYADLNPVWENASFTLLVRSKARDVLELEVWDKDMASAGTFLGRAAVPMSALDDRTSIAMTMNLSDTEHGAVSVSVCYYPLQGREKPGDSAASVDSMASPKTGLNSATLHPTFYQENRARANTLAHAEDDDDGSVNDLGSTDDNNNYAESAKSKVVNEKSSRFGFLTNRRQSVSEGQSPTPSTPGTPSTVRSARKSVSVTSINTTSPNHNHSHNHHSVAGLLVISNICYSKLKSVKSLLTKVHYFAPYFSFTLAQVRKKTECGSAKKSSFEFPDVFQLVVGNTEQDVLHVKLKHSTTMGKQATLAELTVRVLSVATAPNHSLIITHDIYKDREAATGEFSFLATFWPAAALK
jgi:hypothetical protein